VRVAGPRRNHQYARSSVVYWTQREINWRGRRLLCGVGPTRPTFRLALVFLGVARARANAGQFALVAPDISIDGPLCVPFALLGARAVLFSFDHRESTDMIRMRLSVRCTTLIIPSVEALAADQQPHAVRPNASTLPRCPRARRVSRLIVCSKLGDYWIGGGSNRFLPFAFGFFFGVIELTSLEHRPTTKVGLVIFYCVPSGFSAWRGYPGSRMTRRWDESCGVPGAPGSLSAMALRHQYALELMRTRRD
jgi:hypothetical protein